ncbi:MAG: complex I NDUFA9 subunit family protein [Geminicoccaceae bacterium]|nr:complex I NDUFA9 subunit family protein [Geminicoccaceae bacterium]MCX7631505.1 complex I NDUFA9 subunit family protein [Geminicoccaceae bacterium]
MRDKVVTVFGGAGFIGRHLVRRLAARGAVIRVPTRSPEAAVHLLPMGEVGQIVLVRFAEDEAAIRRLVAGAWAVVNLVGILFERRAGDFERVHAKLPETIARAAAEAGVERLVHVSAIGADPASASRYAQTKARGEAAVRAAFPRAAILRPSIVFGPEDNFFNRFAAMARIAPALPLVGGGATRFQPVYVGDVAEAVVRALERPEHDGRVFELGGPKVYTFRELLEYTLKVTGRRRLLLPLPFPLARALARILELLPTPPLTRDQVTLLERDNVVAAGMPGLEALGVAPTPLEAVVPGYLRVYARWLPTMPIA